MDIVKGTTKKFRLKSFLIEGVEKSGKTSFLATLPKPILIFDAERSSESRLAGIEGIDFIECYDKKGEMIGAGYRRFSKNLKELLAMQVIPYKSICLDPLSFISDSVVSELDRTNPGLKGSSSTFSFWGKNKDRHLEIVDQLLSLDQIIGFTCHVKLLEDETTGSKSFLPDINGSFRETIGGKVDAVFFTKIKPKGQKVDYVIQVMPSSQKKCGARVPLGMEDRVGAELPPNYQEIMALLDKKVEITK